VSSPPVIAVVGPSGSGKTTLLERLMGELVARGYRVAAVKSTHRAAHLDVEGKDSWRLRRAGARAVAIAGSEGCELLVGLPRLPLVELAGLLAAVTPLDLVLAEGFKAEKVPKILVVAQGAATPPVGELLAVWGEGPAPPGVRRFTPGGERELVDLVVRRYLEGGATPD